MAGKRNYQLGRLSRAFDPRIPHMSSLLAGKVLDPPPPSVDYTQNMPAQLGVMLNDKLSNCTCAAFYHALQVWAFNAGGDKAVPTEADDLVERLYELACGYKPGTPGEGPGGNEQHVLRYLLLKGAPSGTDGSDPHRIFGFVEVDPRNIDDVKRAIHDCGVAYIGFGLPQNILPPGGEPPAVWNVDPSDPPIVGGHAVVLAGYDAEGARVISWGTYFTMPWEFFTKYVEEVYAIADQTWIDATGKTPGGLTQQQLADQMAALREQAAVPVPDPPTSSS